MKNSKKLVIDSFFIGAALFSMYFGAGNMIFPPYLGLEAGTSWFSGFLGYYIADIGLAVVAILALIRVGGQKNLMDLLGKGVGRIMLFAIVMCIGPIISIPRTAATTYELSIAPLASGFNMPLFYLLFFLLTLLLCIKKSAVVDIVGKILTPVLFLGLLLLIIKGLITPMGDIIESPRSDSVIANGIEAGYQSMDVLASVIFGVLILNSATEKGHTDKGSQARVATGAGLVAGAGLLVIYLGLTYLGASATAHYDMHITRTELLTGIIDTLLPGSFGLIFFAVVAGMACISTSVALTSSAAEYLESISRGKISYKHYVIIIYIFGAVASMVGVEGLISLAAPILSVVYPPVLVLVLLSFLGKWLGVLPIRFAAFTAMAFGLVDALAAFGITVPYVWTLPLASFGLAWVFPSLFMLVIGAVIQRILTNKMKKFKN